MAGSPSINMTVGWLMAGQSLPMSDPSPTNRQWNCDGESDPKGWLFVCFTMLVNDAYYYITCWINWQWWLLSWLMLNCEWWIKISGNGGPYDKSLSMMVIHNAQRSFIIVNDGCSWSPVVGDGLCLIFLGPQREAPGTFDDATEACYERISKPSDSRDMVILMTKLAKLLDFHYLIRLITILKNQSN